MGRKDYTDYQKSTIAHYYKNLEPIMLQKVGELISELYLAESEAKKEKLWDRVHKAIVNLKIPPVIRQHIMDKRDIEILAKNYQDWLAGKKK